MGCCELVFVYRLTSSYLVGLHFLMVLKLLISLVSIFKIIIKIYLLFYFKVVIKYIFKMMNQVSNTHV